LIFLLKPTLSFTYFATLLALASLCASRTAVPPALPPLKSISSTPAQTLFLKHPLYHPASHNSPAIVGRAAADHLRIQERGSGAPKTKYPITRIQERRTRSAQYKAPKNEAWGTRNAQDKNAQKQGLRNEDPGTKPPGTKRPKSRPERPELALASSWGYINLTSPLSTPFAHSLTAHMKSFAIYFLCLKSSHLPIHCCCRSVTSKARQGVVYPFKYYKFSISILNITYTLLPDKYST
jgi:hypothetical protein